MKNSTELTSLPIKRSAKKLKVESPPAALSRASTLLQQQKLNLNRDAKNKEVSILLHAEKQKKLIRSMDKDLSVELQKLDVVGPPSTISTAERKEIQHIMLTSTSSKNDTVKLCFDMLEGVKFEEMKNYLRVLATLKINFDTPDSITGITPLGYAIALLIPEMVYALLELGADPNLATGLPGKKARLPLTIAIGKSHSSEVKNLYPTEVHSRRVHPKKNCLCPTARMSIIAMLLYHPKIELEKRDDEGKTIFNWLDKWEAKDKDIYTYCLLLAAREPIISIAPPTIVDSISKLLASCFHMMKDIDIKHHHGDALKCNIKTAPALLSMVDADTKHTLLGLAITLLRFDYVAVLLAAGANPNLPTGKKDYHLPISIAFSKSHASNLKGSITAGTIFTCPRLAFTSYKEAKNCACKEDRQDILDALLTSPKLNINALEKSGNKTCLNWAHEWKAEKNDRQNLTKLIARGAKLYSELDDFSKFSTLKR